MILKTIRYLAIFSVFFFPFAVAKSLAYPLVFSHVVFLFTIIELSLFLFLFYGLGKGEIIVKKSYLILGLGIYILVLFLTAFTGSEFGLSFWSGYLRMTGIITWLHFFSFFIVISSVFTKEEDWRNIFRALSLSGLLLAIFSFLGVDGLNLDMFAFLEKGGSFLGNTSYSGAYLLLVFFISVIGFLLESKKKWRVVYIISSLVIFFNPDLFSFGIFNGSKSIIEGIKQPMLLVGVARTSALVLWAGILLFLVLFGLNKLKDKKKVIWISLGLIVFSFALYVFGFISLMSGEGRLHDFYVKNSGPMRPMVWNMAVKGIKEQPFLGYGDGNFKYVYQNYLRTEIIHLEDPPWFDRVHNFTLEELVGHGILGAVVLFAIFILIIITSFKQYLESHKFYFLVIPFIFFLHFLQMQTFFQIDSTLLLAFLLLSFLLHQSRDFSIKIPWRKSTAKLQIVLAIAIFTAFIFFVYFPIKENRLIPLIKNTANRSERLKLLAKLNNITIDPVETLRQNSAKFMDETATRASEIEKAGYVENVAEEYQMYINAYEKYVPKYINSHRFLFEYANLINSALIFGVNDLKKGEELAKKSLEISKAYPYAYWIISMNLYYQGKFDEALLYAKQGYELDPTIERSKEIYEELQKRVKSKGLKKSFLYLSDT